MALSKIATPEVVSRRDLMFGLAAAAASQVALGDRMALANESKSNEAKAGRLKQSVAHWCFGSSQWKWTLNQTCEAAVELGCSSVELLQPAMLETIRPYGLQCAMVSFSAKKGPGFVYGWNNPENWPMLEAATREAIDAAAAFGAPNVIAFTGMKARQPGEPEKGEWSMEEGAANCVEGMKRVMGYAEQKGVNICLEMLNSRDGSGRMTGHPGYQGDHVDYCTGILSKIGSPRAKLLFDIYHVQIMEGDLIRRLKEYLPFIAHIHTAGVPGRGELGAKQEINYPAVMSALADLGYQGHVGHEFIPTREPMDGLREAVQMCKV